MKKSAIVLAAAGLISLGACNRTPTEAAADNASDNLEMVADNLEAQADNATDANTAAALDNASERAEDKADAIENSVENTSM